MAYVVEVGGRVGVHLVMSHANTQVGVINGSDNEWYWQIFGFDVVYEASLLQAQTAALREAESLNDRTGNAEDFGLEWSPHSRV